MDLEINCPECGNKVSVTLQDVAKGRGVRCRAGHSFKVVDQGGGARKAQKSLDDLDRALRRLGR